MKAPPVSIRIPRDLLAYIQRKAAQSDLTASQLIRKILRQWQEWSERQNKK